MAMKTNAKQMAKREQAARGGAKAGMPAMKGKGKPVVVIAIGMKKPKGKKRG